eukprot:7387550-Prymnesium_polylepis.1
MALRPRTQYASQPGTPGGLDAIDVSLGLAASHFKQLAQGGNGLLATVPHRTVIDGTSRLASKGPRGMECVKHVHTWLVARTSRS